jgi:hypothetical protein
MSNLSLSQEVLKHVEEIEKQIDNIVVVASSEISILGKCLGPNHGNTNSYNLNSDIQTEDDFYCAVYTLVGLLSLNKNYCEQINISTKEICSLLENQLDEDSINGIYLNIAGPFFEKDPVNDMSLYSTTSLYCGTSSDRFNQIYKSNHYAPNGTKYLQVLEGLLNDYFHASDSIPTFLEILKKALA